MDANDDDANDDDANDDDANDDDANGEDAYHICKYTTSLVNNDQYCN